MPDQPGPATGGGLRWPLELALGGRRWSAPHRAALEVGVEELDDVAHDYRCHDVVGARVRLVLARHTLLYAAVVAEDWDPGRLRVLQTRSAWDDPVLVERSDGVVTRVLEFEPNGHRTPEPNWPHPLRPGADLGASPSSVTPADFQRWWTASTQARPHRRHVSGWWRRLPGLWG